MKGKYAARAANREAARDNELLVEKLAEIEGLKAAVASLEEQLQAEKRDRDSLVTKRADELSAGQKRKLHEQIATLSNRHTDEQVRYALLVWEIMHRTKYGQPAPLVLDRDHPAYQYWCDVHWGIAALFCDDYDAIWRFFELAEGYRWGMAGEAFSTASGRPVQKFSARENTRNMKKAGGIKSAMMRRVVAMRAHYERIWKARAAGELEPILLFANASPNDEHPEDRRDRLLANMRGGEDVEQEAQA